MFDLRNPGGLVLMAALVSGVTGYLVLILAARTLSPATNAYFLVFWGALFSVYGVLTGLTTETTRAVVASRGRSGRTRVVPVVLSVGVAMTAGLAASGAMWAPRLFGSDWVSLLVVTTTGVLLFAVHSSLAGAASGTGEWRAYSLLVAVEPSLRLVLTALAAALSAPLLGFAWATAAASGAWLVLSVVSRRYRALWAVRSDVDPRGLYGRLLAACAAAAASSLLLVGYPVLLGLTTDQVVFETAAPLMLAVSLSRAPLLVPLGAYQNVLVTRVVLRGPRAVLPALLVLAGLTCLGTVLAWLIGPWTLRIVNPDYLVSGAIFATLLVASGLLALLTVSGAVAIGLNRHVIFLAGWIVATVVAFGVLLIPGSLEARVIGSLLLGPVAGTLVHLTALHGRSVRFARPSLQESGTVRDEGN
ncbi:polysaccharide biosynthesis protein [Nocardioides terrigena]|uniref:polysaccharide biosynthesis protein n=1 Tax=Nocardioides terrigena TaxID=424797 RepID=UPI000D313892|nr:polysaccharide biosynthesis protein [Nocardioides terrigena]